MAKLLRFESGLKACYERRKGAYSCAIGVFVGAGSRNEEPDSNGVAHFIEHMLFKGTEKRTAFDIANETDKLGASANAYTSKTNTVFYISGLADYLENYMDVLSDMLFHSTFTAENIERERGVILEEIKMYDDDGESVCSDLLSLKCLSKKSFARPILGTAQSVKALTAEKMRRFLAKNYVAENIILSYCGPMEEQAFYELCKKYFDREFMLRGGNTFKASKQVVKVKPLYVFDHSKPFEQANVIIRFPSYSSEKKESDAASTLARMLGEGMSSRLFQKVREEKGLVYEIYAMGRSIRGFGYIDVGFATTPSMTTDAIRCIKEVVADVKKDGFTKEEFDKVMKVRETSSVLVMETTFDAMRMMGRYYSLTGKLYSPKKYFAELKKQTLEQVNEETKLLDFSKAAVCYVGKDIETDLKELLISEGE